MDLDFFGRVHNRFRIQHINAIQGCFRCYPDNKSSTLGEICAAETRMLWKKHFGFDFVPTRDPSSRLKRNWRMALYPRTVAGPYLARRLLNRSAQ
jgi:hypothetical protein